MTEKEKARKPVDEQEVQRKAEELGLYFGKVINSIISDKSVKN